MEWLCRATSAALMLCLAQSAGAAEIKVLCIPGMKAALEALLPQFERDAGHRRLTLADGAEDVVGSQRVEFKVRTTAEDQLGKILKALAQ